MKFPLLKLRWKAVLHLSLAVALFFGGRISSHADTATTQAVVTAANNFMATLSAAQKTAINSDSSTTLNTSCLYNFNLTNVEVWSNLPVSLTYSGTTRNGLQFASLTTAQQTAALALVTAATSATGKKLFDDIRAADRYISGEVTNAKGTKSTMWGYNKYFVAFIGTPSTTSAWTLQIGGHHLAYNITFNGTYTSTTPIFAGTEPNSWTDSTGTYAPLGTQRSLLVALRPTLTTAALLSGTYTDVVYGANGSGPGSTTGHDTIQPKSYPTSGRGQLYSSLSTTQQGYVLDYIRSWINSQASSIANELLAIYLSPQALAETYIGYSGSSTTLSTNPSYFRVDGPRLWIEFIVQGGVYDQSGVHDHGLVRDKLADYGASYGSTTISTTLRPPTITTQPASQTASAGGSVAFSVVAASAGTGATTLTYQWYKDGTAISGATGSSYTVSPVSASSAGSYSVQVISTGGLVTSSAATLTVGTALSISTVSPLTGGTVGTAYSQTLAATGGTSPYTWSVDSGTVPTGLSLSNAGVLSGTPTAAGTFTFTAKVTDSASATATKSISVTITAALTITTSSPLAGGTVSSAYSQTLAASGGTSPYSWTLASGTLPTGLNLSSAGVLNGTPTAAGTFTFNVTVTDSASGSKTATFTLTVVNAIAITTASPLPGGTVGSAYSQTFAATGGITPYTWSVAAGSTLPGGLSLSSAGVLNGVPTAAGTFTFTVQVTGNEGRSASASFTLTIVSPVTVTTTSPLPGGVTGVFYSQTLAASGGTSPYAWSVVSGTLPTGLSLSSAGVLSGTPNATGTYAFTLQANDSASGTSTKAFSLTVIEPFAAFLAEKGLSSASGADDSDGDGIANAAEFVLGGDPSVANASILPQASSSVANGTVTLQYVFNTAANLGSVTWAVQTSTDLTTWTDAVADANGVSITTIPSATAGYNLVTVTVASTQERTFVRLRVSGY